jgi:DNA-binding NarL/FixJ family response regulator
MVERGELAALLQQPVRDCPDGFTPQQRLSKLEIDQLVQAYRAGEGSIYTLAKRFGIHRQTVALYLKEHGCVLGRRPFSEDELKRVLDLQANGWTANRIGRAIGRDPKTVRTTLAKLR